MRLNKKIDNYVDCKMKEFYKEMNNKGINVLEQDKLANSINKPIGIISDSVATTKGVIEKVNKGILSEEDLMLVYENVHMRNGFDNSKHVDHILQNVQSVTCELWKDTDEMISFFAKASKRGIINHYFNINGVNVWYRTVYDKETMKAIESKIYLAEEW